MEFPITLLKVGMENIQNTICDVYPISLEVRWPNDRHAGLQIEWSRC